MDINQMPAANSFGPQGPTLPPSSTNNANGSYPMMQSAPQIPHPVPSYFVSESLKFEIMQKQQIAMLPSAGTYSDLPPVVENYHTLTVIENQIGQPSSTFGCISSVYKATKMKSGEIVCLRRIHSYPVNANVRSLAATIETWRKLHHANIVPLRHVFTTRAFGDVSIVFVYEYFPGAQTLNNQYFASQISQGLNGFRQNGPFSQQQRSRKLLPESLIWTYIIQLSSALRTIHSAGLACRAFDPTKIILTSGFLPDPNNISIQHLQQQHLQQPRLRLSGCAVFDIIAHETFLIDAQSTPTRTIISQFQQDDLLAFGRICLALACNSMTVIKRENWPQAMEIVTRSYSNDLKTLIWHLLSVRQAPSPRSINDIMPMIGARFYAQLDLMYQRHDIMESELTKEIDNGRLFRILSKLGSINERNEHRMDPQWSETGDRYLLKLFRDYIFHQVCEDGRPWLDMGHIVSTLNKLDMGSPEKLCLVSRDEQNVLIVSYAELKRCFDSAFHELLL
ncbi:PAN2-PAN3 deadenylation complex subunit pan3 [Halotydeus destructor]|nr:PAN2-PAN3 deadenylation complex subunit pan3 [Halotydeus destructor]